MDDSQHGKTHKKSHVFRCFLVVTWMLTALAMRKRPKHPSLSWASVEHRFIASDPASEAATAHYWYVESGKSAQKPSNQPYKHCTQGGEVSQKYMCEYPRRWLIWPKMILLHEFDSMQNTWKLHANGFLRARQQETDLPSRSMLPATTIRTKARLYRFESADHCGFYDFLCHHICHAIWWYLRIFVYKCGVRMSKPLWSRACCQCRTSQAYHCVVAASREVWGWPGPMVCPNSKSYKECIYLFCINANPMCFPGRYYPWKSNIFFVNSLSEKTIVLLTMMSNQQFQWTFLLMILGSNVHNYDNHLLMFIEHNMYVNMCVMLLYHWRPGYLQDVYTIIEWFN